MKNNLELTKHSYQTALINLEEYENRHKELNTYKKVRHYIDKKREELTSNLIKIDKEVTKRNRKNNVKRDNS